MPTFEDRPKFCLGPIEAAKPIGTRPGFTVCPRRSMVARQNWVSYGCIAIRKTVAGLWCERLANFEHLFSDEHRTVCTAGLFYHQTAA